MMGYMEIPGTQVFELPPLLLSHKKVDSKKILQQALALVKDDDFLAPSVADAAGQAERSRTDLAVFLVDKYKKMCWDWSLGNSVAEWIRQCEITAESNLVLKSLVSTVLWPHGARNSFVMLLEEKRAVISNTTAIRNLKKAVGYNLTFRRLPPLRMFSGQFLIYLESCAVEKVYEDWASMNVTSVQPWPPDRFSFQVIDLNQDCLDGPYAM